MYQYCPNCGAPGLRYTGTGFSYGVYYCAICQTETRMIYTDNAYDNDESDDEEIIYPIKE